MEENHYEQFIQAFGESLRKETLLKCVLSKSVPSKTEVQRIEFRRIELKGKTAYACLLKYPTKDETVNLTMMESINRVSRHLGDDFLHGNLFTAEAHLTLEYSKKRKTRLLKKAAVTDVKTEATHDRKKNYLIPAEAKFLQVLGISSTNGLVKATHQAKYRQINKFIETMAATIKKIKLPKEPIIVDMGSGSGTLTFALHYYLTSTGLAPKILGIELRDHLVKKCNEWVKELNWTGLEFMASDIADVQLDHLDILIALHACDTATDLAMHQGISRKAQAIICAPCCHKQIRKEMKNPKDMQAVLKHGILLEKQAELLTDGMRALLLESEGYDAKVFEFVSADHTKKNVMITAVQNPKKENRELFLQEVQNLKKQHGIRSHFLEELLKA